MVINAELARNVEAFWGDNGRQWLAALPAIVGQLAHDWGLVLGSPYELTLHYVVAVTQSDGTPAVLKLGVPGSETLVAEAHALEAFAGRGAVRLLRADLTRGALLLEQVTPGWRARDLVPVDDSAATSAAVSVMRRLHESSPGPALPPLINQATAFDNYLQAYGTAGPLPADLVTRAAGLMRELCDSAPATVVLHGDLHHDNILRGTREAWLAIDPHGLVGDPGYDTGSLLYNPEPDDRDPELVALVPARVEQLADELAMPIDRLIAWGFVKAVLSDVWSAEAWTPGVDWHPHSRALDVAHLLFPRLS